MSREPLDQVLDALAARADAHPAAGRVAAVRRRARRAAAVRAGAAAGAVALVAAALAGAFGDGRPFAREGTPAGPSDPYLQVSVTPAPELETAMPPDPRGEHRLVVMVSVDALVPERQPGPEEDRLEGVHHLDTELRWGDGGSAGRLAGELACAPDAPLVRVRDEYPVTNVYRRPGTYTLTYTYRGCPPVNEVTGSFTVEVE